MIKSFHSKGLRELFEKGRSAKVDKRFQEKAILILDALNAATHTNQLDLPGFVLHPLHQFSPLRWSIRVTAQWRVTFEFEKGDAYRVDLEQYH